MRSVLKKKSFNKVLAVILSLAMFTVCSVTSVVTTSAAVVEEPTAPTIPVTNPDEEEIVVPSDPDDWGSTDVTQPSGSPSENPTDPVSENDSTNVKYSVEPTYIVSIPATVTLGNTATISSDGVVVEKGKQVEVALASTSENDNSFKLKSAEGAEIEYTIKNNGSAVSLNDKVLIVNPDDASTGSSTLSFVAPSGVTYAGRYTGTVTFNVAVANTESTQTPVETPTATAPPEGVE